MKKITSLIIILAIFIFPVLSSAAETPPEKTAGSGGEREGNLLTTFNLEEAIDYALEANYEYLAKEEELKIARAQITEATSEILPHLNLRGIYTDYQNHPTITYGDNIDGLISVSQTLFTGGRIYNTIKQSKSNLKATEENKEGLRQSVIFRVKEVFYLVLLNKEIVDIQKERLALAESNLKTTRARYQAGEVSEYDVLRTEVEVASIKPDLIKAENNLNLAKNRFKLTLGMDVSENLELIGDVKYVPYQGKKETVLEKALLNRPELKEINALKEGGRAAVKASRAGHFPTLSLNCTDYYSQHVVSSEPRDEYDDYLISYVSLDFPLFDGFLTTSRVKQSQAQLEALRIKEKELIENVKVEVENAFLSLNAAQEVVESQSKNVERAKKAYDIMQTRYQHGKASQLDILDAQFALSNAQLNYVQGIYAHIMAQAALVKAIGEE